MTAEPACPALKIEGLKKAFQHDCPVLYDLNLSIAPGEIFFLLGGSGCGKSTILRITAGLLEPDAGRILLNGKDITHAPPERRNTPMVFQNYALWPHLDVFENIAFGLKALKLPAAEIKTRVEQILESVRMTEFIRRKITTLSGGQQQRIALARALALNPAILLLDEPLSNLDAKLRDDMRTEIRRICKERGLTALYVTHDRREALSVGDRIAVMHKGRIRQTGTPREIYLHPADRFVASFLGDADFLPGHCLGPGDQHGLTAFDTPLGILSVRTPATPLPPGKDFTLMFRPEAMRFDAPAEPGINRFDAVLTETSYMGGTSEHRLTAGGLTLTATEQTSPERRPGDRIRLELPADRITPMRASDEPEE